MQDKLPGSLQDKFQDFGSAPSEQLWNSIASNLDEKKKRRGAFWWWFVGAAAIVTLFFGVYHLGYNEGISKKETAIVNKTIKSRSFATNNQIPNNQHQQNEISSDQALANQNKVEQNSDKTNDQKIGNHPLGISLTNISKTNNSQTNSNKINERPNSDKVEIEINQTNLITQEKITLQNNPSFPEVKKFPISEISKINNSFSEPNIDLEPLVEIKNPTPKNKWEFGFNIGALAGIQTMNQDLAAPISLSTVNNLPDENTINGTGESYMFYASTKSTIRRPVRMEFLVSRNIGRRWRLESGINVSILNSKNNLSSFDSAIYRSNFINLEIPVIANYNFVQRKRVNVYAGVGLIYEFPLFEFTKSTSFSNNAFESTSVKTKSFTTGYLIAGQFNTGFRYKFNERLKLDVKPTMRYYIHQSLKGDYPVLERKFWAGATIGLVWQL